MTGETIGVIVAVWFGLLFMLPITVWCVSFSIALWNNLRDERWRR